MVPSLSYAADMAEEDLSVGISLRISVDDRAALDALAAKYPLKALTIARIALRLGLAEVQRNPNALFIGPQIKAAEEQEIDEDLPRVQAETAAGKSVSMPRLFGAAGANTRKNAKKK